MQKRSVICISFMLVVLLSLQGLASWTKAECEAAANRQLDALAADNAADTTVDGNVFTHTWGCSQCAASYEQCDDNVDAKALACAQASGFSPTNTCNRDAEPGYYACANAELACCKPYHVTEQCGSLSDSTPAPLADPKKDCLDDDYYYIEDQCLSFKEASKLCQSKYGVTGYASSQTECDTCPKGQIFNGNECATDPSCPGLSNVVYDADNDYCACKPGFAPMSSGGCQETTRKLVGIAVPTQFSVTVKAGQSQTLNIPLPASLANKDYGSLTLKPSLESKDDAIKAVTFSPASVLLTAGGKTQTITVTISADDVEDFQQYGASIRWNGVDDKQLYAGTTDLKVNIVQPDTPFEPTPDTETATKFEELRQRQLPDMITNWKFGEDQTRTLYAKLDQLDPESSEDLKIMASFVAFVDAFNSLTNPVGTILEETTPLPDSGFGPPLVTRSNPFATLDSKLFAKTLIGVADHSVKLKEAHEKVQAMLKTGGN